MITSTIKFIQTLKEDLKKWDVRTKPWFRGESGENAPLCPKIAAYTTEQENYFVQSFRRKAGGLANTPIRGETDKWLFLAQHYGVPTRLLDWTEGALFALYFAINRNRKNARVYMLNPHRLNEFAMKIEQDYLNFPLTWSPSIDNPKPGYENIALAWENRKENLHKNNGYELPIAVPATYQDQRMIAQRSCFTVHGKELKPIADILKWKNIDISECLFEYNIDTNSIPDILDDLSILGVSAASIFPDLDHLALDMIEEAKNP